MNHFFQNKTVMVIGATGGLGRAFTREFARQGAKIILVARNANALETAAREWNAPAFVVNLQDAASIVQLRESVQAQLQTVDVIVNAAGADVRKLFVEHTAGEIETMLDLNLKSAMVLTQTLLPILSPRGMMVHLGGFADGHLALPYYSADVAARAGLAAFIQALNRELKLSGSEQRVLYFSPLPADTAAERPYHALWEKLGTPIVAPERVALELMHAIEQRKTMHIMGGMTTRLFAKINSIAPRLADAIALDAYGKTMQNYFSGAPVPEKNASAGWTTYLGIALVVLSFALYGALALLPFLPLALQEKAVAGGAFVVVSEIAFWMGGAMLGKELVTRFRRYLDPRTWCKSAGRQTP